MNIVEALKLAGPFLSAGGVGGVWAYMSVRAKVKPEIGASQALIATALGEQTKLLLGESAKDRKDLKVRVNRQDKEIGKLRTSVEECTTKHIECELQAAALKIQVDQLMQAHDPAKYDTLKRVGPKEL